MTIDEMIAVMTAYRDGKEIQWRVREVEIETDGWQTIERPNWNFAVSDYRIAPEPRTIWVNEFENGLFGYTHQTKEDAKSASTVSKRVVQFREVL